MIIAVDFDGILCSDQFPLIGKPNYNMISFIRELMDNGHEVVLWTSRVGDRLTEAVDWCGDRGLHFCQVNHMAPSNAEKYDTNPRKVYADVYIDDHNPSFVFNANTEGYETAIKRTINKVRSIVKWNEEN